MTRVSQIPALIVDSWQLSIAIEGIDKSTARAAVTRGSERGKLKNVHF
jgi:hypothetical protein